MRIHLVASLVSLSALFPSTLPAQAPAAPKAPPRPVATSPRVMSRVFVDVDGGYQSHAFSFNDAREDPAYAENKSWTADYDVKSGPTFGAAAGVRAWRQLGARVGFSTFRDTNAAAIVGTVPHPFFFERNRSFSGSEAGLTQQEDVLDLGAMWLVPVNRHLDVRVFGGPSLFRLKRDLVQDVSYAESYPFDTAEFTGITRSQVSDTTLGFHAGADITYLLAHAIGVGGTVRFSQARFSLTSPADGRSLSIDVGGVQIGGGLRLRFGGGPARRAPDDRQRRLPPSPPASGSTASVPPAMPEKNAAPEAGAGAPHEVSALQAGWVTIRTKAPAYIEPAVKPVPLAVLKPGTKVRVRDEQGDWLMIEFEDARWGTRQGYVLRANCAW